MRFVSLGSSCAVADFLKKTRLKGQSYPFDWILSSPDFTLEMIKLALSEKTTDDIITNHFFKGKWKHDPNMKFISADEGDYANTQFRTVFLHEKKEKTIEKYIRRFNRFREILKTNEKIFFIWAPPGGSPVFDGELVVQSLEPLNEISRLLQDEHRFIVFTDSDFEFESKIEVKRVDKTLRVDQVEAQLMKASGKGLLLRYSCFLDY
jgi:hypothetical protein